MTPIEFRKSVHEVYKKALAAQSTWVSFSDSANRIFQETSVFGSDGGRDFIETNINEIYKTITRAAQSKQQNITISPHNFGTKALEGAASALKELTDMQVELNDKTINIIWAKNVIDLL
ncbi:hypothetical protein [Methylobacterium sp. E-045]|uniref:hypothetical protein n=1 Tax=Methylobacterium sp. E-045 TaxID=2836575 RepID=UPI001FB957EC|nr:hypothetical protein [Methylobacterium sp. E-045]MCJ2127585.1 hypothetical protein [Methylobacterium sp. E-045]